jgi:hypothetical protein
MKVRLKTVGAAMSASVVTVRVSVVAGLYAHHPRFVRALFIPHVGFARVRIHSQDGGRGDRAP